MTNKAKQELADWLKINFDGDKYNTLVRSEVSKHFSAPNYLWINRGLTLSSSGINKFIIKYGTYGIIAKEKVEPTPSPLYDIVIAFDTTESMSKYINSVRIKAVKFAQEFFKHIPNLQMGICAFGDYCDPINTRFQYTNLTSDSNKVVDAINTYKETSGDDSDEFYELVIKKITETTAWRTGSNRLFILIGDANPHPLGYSYKKEVINNTIDWREECEKASKKGITIHTLKITGASWYQECASITGGVCVPFDNANKVSELIKGLIYIDANVEQFQEEKRKVELSGDKQMINSYRIIEEKRTKTDLTKIFSACEGEITVNFHKQVTKEFLEKTIQYHLDNNPSIVVKKLAKECLEGELHTMLCKYTGSRDEFGRFIVIDLNEKGKNNIRTVDPRTIEYIIIGGIKYNRK